MTVEYWLSFNNNEERLRLPVNPNGITVKSPFGIEDLEVTHLGQYSIFGERKFQEMTISSFFPRDYNPSYCEYTDFPSPTACVQLIEDWRDKKKPIRLVVTGTDINIAVTIRDFTRTYQKAGEPGDIYYTLALKEYRWQKTREQVGEVEIAKAKAPTKSQQKAASRPAKLNAKETANKTYTVKSGDSLSKVFGKNWRKVYEANKKTIGTNPNILKPGQQLVIPA